MIFADQESKLLYEYYDPEKMKDIDLLISCGDLPPEYLTFFATLCHAPLLYVKGNHDSKYEYKPPEGCICIERRWNFGPWWVYGVYTGFTKSVYRAENAGPHPEIVVEIMAS